ncbi:MAG: hypothetical protein QOG34_314 [Frankiaceae bacterium]|jgi:hypothetical protein|nr:hypothetical protein [Frankiaceae bacterium]
MRVQRHEAAPSPLQRQLIEVQFELARSGDRREQQLELARRRVNRIASVLGTVAAAVAMYDLSLLATLGRG